jgi:hypothetical protein
LNIQTLIENITPESSTSDFDLNVFTVEFYDEDYNDWQCLNDLILSQSESVKDEVIKELNLISKFYNQPLKVRIFDRDYAELYVEGDEVVIGDLGGGCGSDDYYYKNGELEPTEEFNDI